MLLLLMALVSLAILLLTATSARTASGIFWGGILGAIVMTGGCLLLKFFAGIDQATGGTGDMQKMLNLAVIVGPVVLFCYFIFPFIRLNETKMIAQISSGPPILQALDWNFFGPPRRGVYPEAGTR